MSVHRHTRRMTALGLAVTSALALSFTPFGAGTAHADASDRNLSFSPTEFLFPNPVLVGNSATSAVTVTSSGTEAITITDVSVVGSRAADYVVSEDCVGPLAPSSTCDITVEFSPSFDGRNLAMLEIETDSAGGRAGTGISQFWLTGIGYGSCGTQPFAGGTGTNPDPYVIETIDQFNCIGAADESGLFPYLAKDFRLDADLDAGGVLGAIVPVGASVWSECFEGEFDGNGHEISNVALDDPFSGLFMYVVDAYVHDLTITNAQVTTRFEGGILAAGAENSVVERVIIDGGSLSGLWGNYNGSVAGYVWAGTVDEVTSSASVYATIVDEGAFVGGVTGSIDGGSTVTRSFATGPVSVSYLLPRAGPTSGVVLIGGFAGVVYAASSISDSYATGSVSMTNSSTETYVGGFVGSVEDAGTTITRAYSSGAVTTTGTTTAHIGGFAGRTYGAGAVSDSLWDTTTSEITDDGVDGTTGLTSTEMTDIDSYAGWSIAAAPSTASTWTLQEGVQPAQLSWSVAPELTPATQTLSGTAGTAVTPTAPFTATWFAGDLTYAVTPALPAGLELDASTGVISGTPTAASVSADYTITGTGATSGEAMASVTIAIAAAQSNDGQSSGGESSSGGPAQPSQTPTTSTASSDSSSVDTNTAPSVTPQPVIPVPSTIRIIKDERQAGAARIVRVGATVGNAPSVTVRVGQPVRLNASGMVPGATYEVKVRTPKRPYASMGSATASARGTLRLPTWKASKRMNTTFAIVDASGTPSYLKVKVGSSNNR